MHLDVGSHLEPGVRSNAAHHPIRMTAEKGASFGSDLPEYQTGARRIAERKA
jgi:hypothetical protein